jgi:hypothetical protein
MVAFKELAMVNLVLGVTFAACFVITYVIVAHHFNAGVVTTVAQVAVNTGTTAKPVATPIITAAKTGSNFLFPILAIFAINSSIVTVMSILPITNGVVLARLNRAKITSPEGARFLRTKMPKPILLGVVIAIMAFFAKTAAEFGWAYAVSTVTGPFIMMEGAAVWIGASIPIYALYVWQPDDYGTFIKAFASTANRKTGVLLLGAFLILGVSAILEVYTIHGALAL